MTTPKKKTPPPIPPWEVVLVLRLARKQRKKDEKLKKQLRKTEPQSEAVPPEVIERFTKRYRFLGNFFPAFVVYEGIRYPSSEHAYQAAKFDDIKTKKRIAAIEDSAEAKHFAHSTGPTRSDWEEQKIDVMREVVFAKFRQNNDLKDRLLQTGNAFLEEGNRHGDDFWGTVDGIGENRLGIILMEVREYLYNERHAMKNNSGNISEKEVLEMRKEMQEERRHEKTTTKTTNEIIQEIVNIVRSPEVKRIAVSGHTAPDGDSIAACVAFAWLVRKATGKGVDVFVFGDFPERFRFLDPDRMIHSIYTSKQFKGDGLVKLFGQYDLAVSLDTALVRQFPNNYYEHIFLKSPKTIKIDHHPYMETFDKDIGEMVSNDFAQCNLMDDSFNSSTQIVWRMVEPFGLQYDGLDKSFLDAIYTGLITDTGTFLYAKNAQAFHDAAAILDQGIDHIETRRKTFGDIPLCIYRIRQNVQRNVRFSENGRIAWLTEDDELKSLKVEAKGIGCKDEAAEEIIITLCELLQVQGVEIVLKVNDTNFSVKSKRVDISKLAMKYGGGGHVNASAFSVTRDGRTNEEILEIIISEYQEEIDNEKSSNPN